MANQIQFQKKVQELIPDSGQRDQLFEALRRYQSSQKLHQLLLDLRQLLDEPDKLELFEFIRPLILLRHQMEYSYLTPPAPGVRLRTLRLHRTPNTSLGFAVRGGYEFSVGVFVSHVEPGSQADRQGLKVGDEIVRVNGFTIAEAIHDDVLNLIKSRDEIVLKVTHIGMLPVKEHATDTVTWQYVDDMDSKKALAEVLSGKQVQGGKGVELKIFIDCTGYDSIGCGILSGPHYYPGIFVEKVRPGSLAQEVGLEVGDQIVEVNDSSFSNIGHKEAVVVLKGSKQLNVIVRKHAGLPLFERRQTAPSQGSSLPAPSSTTTATTGTSLPVSQRSQADSGGLDEEQLIAEQLGRTTLLKQTAPIPSSSQATEQPHPHCTGEGNVICTQAEVHSDSDSYPGSGGEGPGLPVEEPSPAGSSLTIAPTSVPSSLTPPSFPTSIPTPTTSTITVNPSLFSFLALPDNLDPSTISSNNRTADTEHFTDHHSPPPSSSSTTSSADPPTPTLSLPDDLGDPVLAALRPPSYPHDSLDWLIPLSYASGRVDAVLAHGRELHSRAGGPDTMSSVHRAQGEKREERGFDAESCDSVADALVHSERMGSISVEKTEEERGEGSVGDEHSEGLCGIVGSLSGAVCAGGVRGILVKQEGSEGGGERVQKGRQETQCCVPTGDSVMVQQSAGMTTQGDDHSSVDIKDGSQALPQSDAETCAMGSITTAAAADVRREEVEKTGVNIVLSGSSNPPVFVPPPPPSSPPPPLNVSFSPLSGDAIPWSCKTPPSPSRLSSTSTQTPQGDGEGGTLGLAQDGFVAIMEFGSETTEESSLCLQEIEEEEEEEMAVVAVKIREAESVLGRGPGLIGEASVSMQVTADVHRWAGSQVTQVRDHGDLDLDLLPPPPASFFDGGDDGGDGDEDDRDENYVEHAGDTTVSPQLGSTHADYTSTHTITTLAKTATGGDTLPPPPPPPPPPLPPVSSQKSGILQQPASPLSPSFSVVLGGAAAVLAARREARPLEESGPQLLGPAEQAWVSTSQPLSSHGDSRSSPHEHLAALFNPLELDGRELKTFTYPKSQPLGVALEGGTGTPLAGRIVVAAVFGSGAAVERGLQTGDQLMMVNGHKLTDVSVAEAEHILEQESSGPREMIQLVYAQSNFLNDEECVTYF